MRKFVLLALIFAGFIGDSYAAPARRARASAAEATVGARTPQTSTARAGTTARSAVRGVSARSAAPVATAPKVAARAAVTTQKVVGTGTKVASAAKNVTVSESCREKYEGCMDSFCMLDNDTGGRCLCSDKNAEYDAILAEIEKLDQQSYQMATFGVEKLEMGADADAAIAGADAVVQTIINREEKSKSRELDLSLWDTAGVLEDEDETFAGGQQGGIADQTGDALHLAAQQLCVAQMPECAGDMEMLKLMYSQHVKSDCVAYENSLKQQKTASQQKLYAAEQALRSAALEQYQKANKYDLGRCSVEFRKCMQTTGGCGEDFSQCATMVALDSTNVRKSTSKGANTFLIKGVATNIEISASTFDTLMAKKPLCEHVTESCAKVANQVWDVFLRDVAPQIKSAELIAEDKARQDCTGNISACIQKACKDTIDPNDPDGSMDMCLTRPESVLSLCKVPMNACGIDVTDEDALGTSSIWMYVKARLAAMRVDSCTNAVKECLQSEDRCGKDYTQCIGLDLEALQTMCPEEKLLACNQPADTALGASGNWQKFEEVVQGIWLGIDNAMLDECQRLVDEKMLEICGDTISCPYFETDKDIGTDSLIGYNNGDGNYVIDGMVSYGNIKVTKTKPANNNNDDEVKFGIYEIDINNYKKALENASVTDASGGVDPKVTTAGAERALASLQNVATKINQKIAVLTEDAKISMCVRGRDISQIKADKQKYSRDNTTTTGKFPYLLDSSILAIIESGVQQANKNYTKKFNELVADALEQKDDDIKAVLCAAMASDNQPECTEWTATSQGVALCKAYEPSQSFELAFGGVSDGNDKLGLTFDKNTYATKYVIAGAKLADLAAVQQKGHSEFIQTDGRGNPMGRITTSSVYSAADDACVLTTQSLTCKEAEKIITVDLKCSSGGITIGGGNGKCGGGGGIFNLGGSSYTRTENFHGVMCKEFLEPVTTTVKIEM